MPFTLNIKWQCTITSLLAWYMVRDNRLTVNRPISEPLRPDDGNYRCLYHSLHYLDLRPPVGYVFKGWTMHAYSRWLSGENRGSLRLGLECSCLE